MVEWTTDQELAEIGAHGGDTVVVLIRGDLVRHYPTVRVLLVDPVTNIASLPTFGGWIPPDVRFMAFDVASAEVVTTPGSGWRVVLEEQPTEPRFGLDTIAEGEERPTAHDVERAQLGSRRYGDSAITSSSRARCGPTRRSTTRRGAGTPRTWRKPPTRRRSGSRSTSTN